MRASIDTVKLLQYDAANMSPEGSRVFNTIIDPASSLFSYGAVDMNFEDGTSTEPLSVFDTDTNPIDSLPHFCMSRMSAEDDALTRLLLQQDGEAPEISYRVEKWTPDMDAFVVERKLQGDTLALIAKKMQEKFGVSVNPNILTKRSTKIIEKVSKDNIVVKAIAAAEGRIIKAVEDEIKRFNIPDKDILDEVNREMMRKLPDMLKVLGVKLWTREHRRGKVSEFPPPSVENL